MKFIFLLGGACGFLIAGLTGYATGRSADRILLDSAVGCLAGALLFRWLWEAFLRCFRETYLARQQAAAEAAATAPAPAAAPTRAPASAPVPARNGAAKPARI
jgi:hypothetical protein